MKRGITFAAAILLGVSMIGCQSPEAETEIQTQTEVATETNIDNIETEEATETETETEAETEVKQRNTIIGSIEEIDMEKITVLTDNGNEIILPIKTAELDFRSGFRVGNLVAIEYTGDIIAKDNTASDVEVTRVADSADNSLNIGNVPEETEAKAEAESETSKESAAGESETTTESEAETETKAETEAETSSEADVETEAAESANELKATLENITMGELTVITAEGSEATFKIVNTRLYFERGMAKGTPIAISYHGEFTGQNAEGIEVVFVRNEGEAPEVVEETEAATEAMTESETMSEAESETETTTEAPKAEETETGETSSEAANETEKSDEAAATERCHVRKGPSADTDSLGKLDADETVTRVKDLDSGWTEVVYQGKTGYVKSEFLK